MVADIPATEKQMARHLGITPETLRRYIKSGQAPRPIMLAMFWETRWGRSAADCEAAQFGQVHAAHAQALARENAKLREQLTALEQMVNSGAANAPFFKFG
jgi:predicted transcriptional regulator